MPVSYSPESAGPSTRASGQQENENYYKDITTTGAAADLAAELGLDLSEIEGTGVNGKITKADVEAAAK